MRTPTIVVARSAEPIDVQRGFSLRALLHVLFKRKWLVLLVALACAVALQAFAWFYSAPRYQAYAQILVSPEEAMLPAERPVARGPGADEQIARTIRLLAGRSLAEDVVRAIGPAVLYPELAERFSGDPNRRVRAVAARVLDRLDIQPAGRSSIVSVSFVHADPVLAARVVNLLGEKYVDRHLSVQNNPRSDAFFRQQAESTLRQLEESRRALEAFRQRHELNGSFEEEHARAAAELSGIGSAVAQARSMRSALEAHTAALGASLGREVVVPETHYREKERLTELELRESELRQRFTPEHPTLREVREQIASLREALARPPGASAPYETRSEQEQARISTQAELLRLRSEIETARAREQALAGQRAALERKLQTLRTIEAPLRVLQQRASADEQSYRVYATKVDGARVADAMAAQRLIGVRVIEPAAIPTEPLPPRFPLAPWMSLLAGLGAGIVAAFLLELAGGRLDTREQVEQALGLPVLASVLEMKRVPRLRFSEGRHSPP